MTPTIEKDIYFRIPETFVHVWSITVVKKKWRPSVPQLDLGSAAHKDIEINTNVSTVPRATHLPGIRANCAVQRANNAHMDLRG